VEHIAKVVELVESKKREYMSLADAIWSYAEMRYAEFESSERHAAAIEASGFRVTRGVAGMPTAFVAEARVGSAGGPVIGFLGEYDALAGLNQESGATVCRPSPDAVNGNGHGCGHHLLGTASHLAAVVARDYFAEHNIPATIRFYGCPAEEAAAGKTFMAREGLFDDLDVALCWHPSVANSVFMNATLANVQAYFRFHGKASHAAWRRISDAVRSMPQNS
jgi:aminobenzoyl-glutamate utilization protein B